MSYKQVVGGDPLLELLAVDWFKVNERFDSVALHPKSLVQVSLSDKLYHYPSLTGISYLIVGVIASIFLILVQ